MSKTIFENPEYFDHIFEAFTEAFQILNVEAFLIGAKARDVWFLPSRAYRFTRDVDWVLANDDEKTFQDLKQYLIHQKNYTLQSNGYSMLSPQGIKVDIVPFVGTTLKLEGLQEVFERGAEIPHGKTYRAATLPAIIFLKLLAWNNRPEERAKDIQDIADIMKRYFDLTDDDIFDNHNDLFNERELDEIAARVIGRKISYILGDSLDLKQLIIQILERNIEDPNNSRMARIMVQVNEKSEHEAAHLLSEMLIGIKEI
jgi:predicted nucleotidyltransferase